MANLIEQILLMEADECDAIMLQYKSGNGAPNYERSDAIIRRFMTAGGYQWALSSVFLGRLGSGIYGTIDEIVKEAERQFGVKSDLREWVQISYSDKDCPVNFIPDRDSLVRSQLRDLSRGEI